MLLNISLLRLHAADEKTRIAILNFSGKQTPAHVPQITTYLIRGKIVKSGIFYASERAQLDAVLQSQGLQITGCSDQTCSVKIGKLLYAEKIITGNVAMFGNAFVINARLIDIKKNQVDLNLTEYAASEDSLDDAAANITKKVIDFISKDKIRTAADFKKEKELKEKQEKEAREKEAARKIAKPDKKKDSQIMLPSGIRLSYMLAMPLSSPFKDYFPVLHGVEVMYSHFFNNYFSIKAGVSFSINTFNNPKIYSCLNAYSFGANFGIPVIGFIYPYIGASVKGIWIHEQANDLFHEMGGMGIDFSTGVAFTIVKFFGVYVEYSIGWAMVIDKASTDISSHSVKAGVYFRF